VRAVILRAVRDFLTHTEIVPLCIGVGKVPFYAPRTTAGGPAVVRLPLARSGLPGSGVAITGGGNPEAG
jgi:hypothetical protein